jgi:membrane protease YdiL (CAAX protease family)
MVADHTDSWEPDRRWADAAIALLGLAIALLLFWRLAQPLPKAAALEQISVQARIWEIQQSIRSLADPRFTALMPGSTLGKQAGQASNYWDRALLAVLATENGEPELGRALAMGGQASEEPSAMAFRRCFSAAYLSGSEAPSPEDRKLVDQALRHGYAAYLLEARLQSATDPVAAQRTREEARAWAMPRVAGLALAGLAFALLVPSGIAMILVLVLSPGQLPPFQLPIIRLSGKTLLIVFLSWFLVFLLSGFIVSGLALQIRFLQPYVLPLTYGFHAAVGIGLLCWAENLSLSDFLRRLMPGPPGRSLAWGLAFLAVAVVLVLSVSLVMNLFLRQQEAPQRQLMEVVANTRGTFPLVLLLLTVSVVAPVFEEYLFRGTFLPWLGQRLEGPLGQRLGWISALLLTSLGFGLIHLQPAALPVLSTLGLALGLAFLRTRNLLTSILVHGIWNGGVFLFFRVVLS